MKRPKCVQNQNGGGISRQGSNSWKKESNQIAWGRADSLFKELVNQTLASDNAFHKMGRTTRILQNLRQARKLTPKTI
jgi:hypothetical protein